MSDKEKEIEKLTLLKDRYYIILHKMDDDTFTLTAYDTTSSYKEGELPADYSKDAPVGQKIDMNIHANDETRPNDFPKQGNKNKVDPAVFRMADERDY